MYDVESNGTSLKAWVHWGDNFPLTMALYEDDGITPQSLVGKTPILGIEKSGVLKLSIYGVVTENQVVFNINYDIYKDALVEGGKYDFDWWESTNRETKIKNSTIEFKKVFHDTEV